MKILAFVDTHGNKEALDKIVKAGKEADILVCAGDITSWGRAAKSMFDELQKIGKPLLMIHGNHEDDDAFRKLCEKYDYITFIHRGSYQMGRIKFFGYGGGGFAQQNVDFENISNKFVKTLKKGDIIILVTHAPPHNTKLDYLEEVGHVGCTSLRSFIDQVKPILHICGHLHETFDVKEVVGNTLVINPGPAGKILQI